MAPRTTKPPSKTKADFSLPTLIELFILSKQIEGRSPKTLSWYQANLTRFSDFLAGEHTPTLQEITLDNARTFVAHLQGKSTRYDEHHMRPTEKGGLSPHSVHAYVRTLKTFGSWLVEEEYVEVHPFQRLKPPKLPDTMIEVLSDDEIRRMIAAISPDTVLGARLHAIVLLLLDTGLRASELCGLTVANTHLQEGYVKVRGKGEKERIVPFCNVTKKSLLRYLHSYRPEPTKDGVDNFFLSVDGAPLATNGLGQVLRRLGKASDVPRLHPHLFRHTFAVRYLMNGGDIMTLRLMLGHSSLEVTQLYLHLAESHVQVQHSRFSPVERLDIGKRRKR
ncbi:MAG: tyrosine-type recombinase/integrase [Anaerolineae bacterium]